MLPLQVKFFAVPSKVLPSGRTSTVTHSPKVHLISSYFIQFDPISKTSCCYWRLNHRCRCGHVKGHQCKMAKDELCEQGAPKRRKLSHSFNNRAGQQDSQLTSSGPSTASHITDHDIANPADESLQLDEDGDISLPATSKLAGKAVAPFLAKHIPDQYAPMGGNDPARKSEQKDYATKYCYRHRPDLKCRRQIDEPSMAQLQEVSVTVDLCVQTI